MNRITDHDPESKSPDLAAENLAKLKLLFPELATEGEHGVAVNLDVLKQLVGDKTVTDADEKYGLNWHGKRAARQLGLTPSAGTLRPCPEDSEDWDTTQNLMIEGDNLEVLKLLQKSYSGKVKLIYIDPPYNTGKDFVYPDNFQDNIHNYLELTGQTGDGGRKLSSNTEASGRFHTDWLNMMYPRLKLAKNLLAEDGLVLVSIDDGEIHHVRIVLDDVFGSENFVGVFIWEGGRKNDTRRISLGHDYIVVYARNHGVLKEKDVRWRERKSGLDEIYAKATEARKSYSDDFASASKYLQEWFKQLPEGHPSKAHSHYKMVDAGGVWYGDNISSPNYRANLVFSFKGFNPPTNGWRYDKESMDRLDQEGLLIYPSSQDQRIQYKRYLHQTEYWAPASVFYQDRRTASKALTSLMGEEVFDFPKDIGVISRLVDAIAVDKDLILDFFAGSGATGEAVVAQNLRSGKSRRYLLVQLPELLDPEKKEQKVAADYCDKLRKPRTIAELTKERLRRAGRKLREENPLFAGDLGFRVFKLDSSNIQAWNPDRANIAESLQAHAQNLKVDRTEQDILFELLLKLGLDLTVPIVQRTIAGKTVHSIGGGVLLVCLSTSVTQEEAEPLALGVIAWHKEQAPSGESTVVFRDSAFSDDVAKSNLSAILQQHGLENVRSI